MVDETQAAVNEVKRGASSFVVLIGKWFVRLYHTTLVALWHSFLGLSLAGKVIAVIGMLAIVGDIGFAVYDAMEFDYTHQKLVVVQTKVANVRVDMDLNSKVIARVRGGEKLQKLGQSDEGWWLVFKEGWPVKGWISKKIAEDDEQKLLTINYHMKGYGWGLLAALLVTFIGFKLEDKSRRIRR